MKQHLWSNPNTQWEGFKPITYWLDSKALELPLTRKLEDGKTDETTTVGIIYDSLKNKQIMPEFLTGGTSVKIELKTTDGAKLLIGGPDFSRRMLDVMLKLRAEGIDPFSTAWYYYDKDWCRQDPQESYSFFIVQNEKIIREQVSFFDDHYSGFDPSVFGKDDHSDPIWSDEEVWAEAGAKYWYRKFYSETCTGQLMLLRSDEPKLFYRDEREGPDIVGALGAVARSLDSIRVLLWILVILALVSLILHWR
jgi:hypothetical protein